MKKGWRIAVAVIGAVAVLALAGFLVWRFSADETVSIGGATSGTPGGGRSLPVPVSAGEAHGLPGMPADYTLTESQLEEKAAIVTSGVLADVDALTPGTHYVDGEFLFGAASQAEAETIAAAYGAELVSFSGGLGLGRLSEGTTHTLRELFAASADTGNNLPPISLNLIRAQD